MALDFPVAARQAFGTTASAAAVSKLLSGQLAMNPHPVWILPPEIDWAADPFQDVNWRSQYHMLRWLDPLRRAAAKGDDAAFAMWIRYVRDWVRSNPREKPAHKWVWSDMVDGIRAIQLCLAAPLVRDKSPEDLEWLEQTIRDHAEFMANPANLGHSNHAMHQHEALFVCGRTLSDPRFTELAVSRFNELLAAQYDEQGVNAEGAIAYHYNNYLWYERVLKRFDAEGFDRPAAAARHARAPEEIAHATRPDGTFVGIGDTDGGSPRAIGSPFTDYVSSAGADGEPPSDLLKIYDQGYLFARSGWGETERNYDEETFFSVSFGRSDRVHGHPDGGSLTFSAGAVNWLVDPGKYQYGGGVERRHMLSRASHSLVSLDGVKPRKGATVSLLRASVTQHAYDVLFSDDTFSGIGLTRRVIYSLNGDYLVVIDHVHSRKEVTARQRWQLGPGVDAAISRHRVEMTSGGRQAVLAFAGTATDLDQVTGSEEPFDGWVATGWKKKVPATAVIATKTGTSFRFITVIAAGAGIAPTATTVPTDAPGFCLEVSTGRVTEQIVIREDDVSFPADLGSVEHDDADGHVAVAASALPTASGRLPHLDASNRQQIFDLLTDARNSGRNSTTDERRAAARNLLAEARARGLEGDVDLGVTAAITDLRQKVRGRVDPKKVEPHRTALINWDGEPGWRPTFYPMPLVHHGSALTFDERPSETQILTVNSGPLVLPLALAPDPGEVLTVLFHGALDRAKLRLPIFQRWRYQVELQAGPTLAIGDPTLDLSGSMRLGWYLGTESTDLVPWIAGSIQRIARALGVSRIVLVGSSGGGFAALQVGAFLPRSVVVAMSPQTDLRSYSPRLVNAAIGPAFGSPTISDAGVESFRLSAADRFSSRTAYPRVELVSNPGDRVHVKHHESPLRAAYSAAGLSKLFRTTEIDLGPGHRSLDNTAYGDVMRKVYGSE